MSRTRAPYDLFQWLSEAARSAFVRNARSRQYAPGTTIYFEGEAGNELFRIVSGTVRLYVARPSGQEVIYALFEPGDCFGDSSCIDGEPRSQTAEAVGAVEVQVLDRAAFDRMRQLYREFEDALLRLITRQVRLLSVFNADSHLSNLSARVASRIVTVAQSFGVANEAGIRLSLRLPQSELALMVGASRQTVNRVLRQFQDEGLILIEYGTLVVLALERLKIKAGVRPADVHPLSRS